MQEHVGKKRKKELRTASDLKKERDSSLRKCIIVFGIAVVICLAYFLCCTFDILITYDNLVLTFIPLAVVVAALFIAGSDVTKAQVANSNYKKFCEEHAVTKEDLQHFEEVVS